MQEDQEVKTSLCYIVYLIPGFHETLSQNLYKLFSPKLEPVGPFKHLVLIVQITCQNSSMILFKLPSSGHIPTCSWSL